MKYKIECNFRNHKTGDIIEEYEYNRLPINIKSRTMKLVDSETISQILENVRRSRKKK